ncbi:MAG: tail fiber domain-containing protein [Bacteroidota bacterium]
MKTITFFLFSLCWSSYLYAQHFAPQAINYQAAIRDTAGNPLDNTQLDLLFTIFDSVMNGQEVYKESWNNLTTNQLGLLTAAIGKGNPVQIGTQPSIFSNIQWGSNPKFIKVEVKLQGSSAWQDMGQSELLAVPYALFSENGGYWKRTDRHVFFPDSVGIGTSSPNMRLSIAGGLEFQSSDGVFHRVAMLKTNVEPNGNSDLGIWTRELGDQFERVTITHDGNVGIGNTNPSWRLEVNGTACKPGGGQWSTPSDLRLKTNIRNYDLGLSHILKIRPVSYHYNGKLDLPVEPQYIGVIAQELQKFAPQMVSAYEGSDGENYLSVDPSAFTYMLINAVQELQQQINQLEAKVVSLQEP